MIIYELYIWTLLKIIFWLLKLPCPPLWSSAESHYSLLKSRSISVKDFYANHFKQCVINVPFSQTFYTSICPIHLNQGWLQMIKDKCYFKKPSKLLPPTSGKVASLSSVSAPHQPLVFLPTSSDCDPPHAPPSLPGQDSQGKRLTPATPSLSDSFPAAVMDAIRKKM